MVRARETNDAITQSRSRRKHDQSASADTLVIITNATVHFSPAELARRHYIQPIGNTTAGRFIPKVGQRIGRTRKRSVGPVVVGSAAVGIKASACELNRRRDAGLGSYQPYLDIRELTERSGNVLRDGGQADTCFLASHEFIRN